MKALREFFLAQANAYNQLAAAVDQGLFSVHGTPVVAPTQALVQQAPVTQAPAQTFQPQVQAPATTFQPQVAPTAVPAAPPVAGERLAIPPAETIKSAEWKKERVLALVAQEGWAGSVLQRTGETDLSSVKVVALKEAVQAIIQSLGGAPATTGFVAPAAPMQTFQPQVQPAATTFQPQVQQAPVTQAFVPQVATAPAVVAPPGAPQIFTPQVQAPPPPVSYPLVEQFKARLAQELASTGGVVFNSWTSQEHYNRATTLQANLAGPLAQVRQLQPGQPGYDHFQVLLAYFAKQGCQANCATCPRGPGQVLYCNGVFDNEYPGAQQMQFGANTVGVFSIAPENIGANPPVPARLVETPRC